ncbi:hypothetical protein DFH07DRAFT_965541 [Mycena maculata]|uniref:Uncharacterized protein n=1 Tax=Mycena maculata TaxID=230809 RepID=A0AAD7N1D1_9AGAR|nr:hypothetical protein DFH07DRAFT_965541 [Mycena maculata]
MPGFLGHAACMYVAVKAERGVLYTSRTLSRIAHAEDYYGATNFPPDNSKLAETEPHLVDDLDCDLTVFHSYRTLLVLWRVARAAPEEEAGETGVELAADDGPRHWGTNDGLQMAWFMVNDTYRSELCLLYSPHLIVIAALYLASGASPFASDGRAVGVRETTDVIFGLVAMCEGSDSHLADLCSELSAKARCDSGGVHRDSLRRTKVVLEPWRARNIIDSFATRGLGVRRPTPSSPHSSTRAPPHSRRHTLLPPSIHSLIRLFSPTI